MTVAAPVRRLSVESSDVGHFAWAELMRTGHAAIIRLDGEEQHRVITADADKGYIKRYNVEPDYERGEWPIEEVTGNVEIEIVKAKS